VRGPLGRKQVSKIQTGDIQRIVNEMNLSPRTIRYMHAVLSSALKAAIQPPWRLLAFNPADYVTLPKQEHTERQWLTEDMARKFLGALSEDKYGLMFELALLTGLRPEEYLALKWTDLEPERETITRQSRVVPQEKRRWVLFFRTEDQKEQTDYSPSLSLSRPAS
jgi:integrase